MDWKDIKQKAKDLGLKTSKVKKPELIKKIQLAEGNFDCFGSAEHECDQAGCAWRDDCLK